MVAIEILLPRARQHRWNTRKSDATTFRSRIRAGRFGLSLRLCHLRDDGTRIPLTRAA